MKRFSPRPLRSGADAIRCCIALAVIAATLVAGPAGAETVRILHTNDMHAHLVPFVTPRGDTLGGSARLSTLLKEERRAVPASLYVDAGDLFQGTPFYNFFHGEAEIRVLSALRCDAMVLGNHELDNGPAAFLDLVRKHAKFPVLCANVFYTPTTAGDSTASRAPRPLGLPSTVLSAGPVRVGVIGVTTETLPRIVAGKNSRDLEIRPVVESVARLVPEVRKSADLVVVLSHCGLAADSLLAANVPGIDVIVSGHDHQALPEPRLVRNSAATNGIGGTLLVETGDFGRNLGRLDLEIEGGRLVGYEGRLLPVTPRLAEDPAVASIVAEYERQIGPLVSEVIATATAPFGMDSLLTRETALGNLVTDMMREEAGTDIAVQNGGGIRSPLNKGEIRLGDLFSVIPFENTIVTVRLAGHQVEDLCREMVGLRGTGGFGQVSGLRFDVVEGRPVNIEVDGKPLDSERYYRVATNNFTAAGGDGIATFGQGAAFEDTGILLRDAVVAGLKQARVVEPRIEGRIRFR